MYRLDHFITISILLIFCFSCHQNQPVKSADAINRKWVKIPDDWINKARQLKNNLSDTVLIQEFAKIIKPDTLDSSRGTHVSDVNNYMFTCIAVDLDGDRDDELICLQGWDIYDPCLCVFKQINGSWYLIYKELIDTFYDAPTICIANNPSKNKVFYIRRVLDHGSDIYIDGYSFYKLVDSQVYDCLDIINDAHVDGWGLYLNESVSSKFYFDGNGDDDLNVKYNYKFYPGNIYQTDCPWCSHDDISLISGDDVVSYEYNNKHHKFELHIQPYNNSAFDLTAEKIKRFADFGDDSLFVKAYRRQIDTTIKIGTPLQKKILNKYLSLVNKDKVARTESLEKKTEAGGTTFYGPSN